MSTYQDYQKQIEELRAKAEEARKVEVADARGKILAIMKEYGLTVSDLGAPRVPKTPRKPVEIKYRDNSTGETWTGRGRTPKWLEGKDKNAFLVG